MKTILNLAWLAIGLATATLGYLIIWDYAQTPDLALFVIAVGLINAYWGYAGIRRPKAKIYQITSGVRYV